MFSIFTPRNAARRISQYAACAAIMVFSNAALGEEIAAEANTDQTTTSAAISRFTTTETEIVVTATRSAKPLSQVGS